jgi:hypothetical protein
MLPVASTVGVEDTRPHERSHPASAHTARPWVTFSFGSQTAREAAPDLEDDPPSDRYRLEVMRAIHGSTFSSDLADVSPGCLVARRETESVRPPAVLCPALQGSLDVKHSSDEEASRALLSAWARSPWRVALVLLFSNRPDFWDLPREDRRHNYLGWNGAHFSKRPGVMARVLRRLYRARALPASQWDYLAYLEMQPEDVAHVREHLAGLRDVKANPPRAHVAREVELWLTKQVGASGPARPSERLRDRTGA